MGAARKTGMTDQILDLRGLQCPLPVLRTERRLRDLPPGARLTVLATDPQARAELEEMCRRHGHAVEAMAEADGVLRAALRRTG
jgi:tRNA 2-thiouridine synthesizing protein A